jgi:hypothetical protein
MNVLRVRTVVEYDERKVANLHRSECEEVGSVKVLSRFIVGSPRRLTAKVGGGSKVPVGIVVRVSVPIAFNSRALCNEAVDLGHHRGSGLEKVEELIGGKGSWLRQAEGSAALVQFVTIGERPILSIVVFSEGKFHGALGARCSSSNEEGGRGLHRQGRRGE